MNKNNQLGARFILQKLLLRHGDEVAASHRWLSEQDRWNELVFAIFASLGGLPEHKLRALVQEMNVLQLLTISELAHIRTAGFGAQPARRCLSIMLDAGMSRSIAQRSLMAVAEAAAAMQNKYSGKVQRFLRSHGERIRADLQTTIGFSGLKTEEAVFALTYWLQNVLSIPLSLRDKKMAEFESAAHVSGNDILEAADQLDINLAVVDDLINLERSRINQPRRATRKGEKHAR